MYGEERSKKKKRLNRSLLKQFKTSLGPEQERLITQKDTEIEELQKSIQEDRGIAEDENEDQAIREKVIERNVALDNDREELEEGTSQRVRVRNILKKYGFTVSAVVLAVGTTIGVIISLVTQSLQSVAKGLTLGSQIAGILPGLFLTKDMSFCLMLRIQSC